MPETKTTAKRNEAGSKTLTSEEKAALRELAKERKAEAAKGDLKAALLAKIAEMPEADRVMAEKFHEIVTRVAPDLTPKTYYGMPAYARDGKIVCFFQAADKFKARYATIGFDERANLDDGNMWPTSWAITKMTPAEEKRIAELVKKAVS